MVGVACGSGTLYALEKGGSAFAWGGGANGELGIGAVTRAVATPTRMLWAIDVEHLSGSVGGKFGAAVDAQGRLYTFGNGEATCKDAATTCALLSWLINRMGSQKDLFAVHELIAS